jgi:predicted regulator of Ras-like GTPase activity (Roadblock/LC7/MglB family)
MTRRPDAETPVPGYGTVAVLDRVTRSPGVTAASFFKEGSITASRGRNIPGDLAESAEEILLPAWEAMALVSDGPLVQVTLQLEDRNITIAPHEDGYLLFMTEPGINLGQIRRLLQEAAGSGKV